MIEFKIILFINPQQDISRNLMEWLRQFNYNPIICHDPDEVNQCGLQANGVMLCFDDITFAYQYLKQNSWTGFPVNKFLWHPTKPLIREEQRAMVDEVGLKFFTEGQEKDLLQFLVVCSDSNILLSEEYLSRRGDE